MLGSKLSFFPAIWGPLLAALILSLVLGTPVRMRSLCFLIGVKGPLLPRVKKDPEGNGGDPTIDVGF